MKESLFSLKPFYLGYIKKKKKKKAYISVLGNQGHDEDETERKLKSVMLEKVRIKIII